MTWQNEYLSRYYNTEKGWVEGTPQFHSKCAERIAKGARILEIGAGPSNATSRFLSTLGDLSGVDIDERVLGNDALSCAKVVTTSTLPFASASFDACVSNYVLEHIEQPLEHLREVARVLARGGVYLFRTPNRFHYVSIVSSLTPHWFHHVFANRLRDLPAHAEAPYPTYYRLNTPFAIRKYAASAGLRISSLDMVEKEPRYGLASRPLFFAFMAYERAVNSTPRMANFRANLFGILEK